jgi:CheY-like chemotaxis protein
MGSSFIEGRTADYGSVGCVCRQPYKRCFAISDSCLFEPDLTSTFNCAALALIADALPQDRARALTAGFQQYVAKPVDPDELAAVVTAMTGRKDAPSLV